MSAREKTFTLRPGMLGALRGLWLFTWKPQLTWRRLPIRILGLLVLPFLVYVTTSPRLWSQRPPLLGNAAARVRELARSLNRAGQPLRPEQEAQLQQIFLEEFARTETDWRQSANADDLSARESELIKGCYNRISQRTQALLNESQFSEFQRLEPRWQTQDQGRAREPGWSRPVAFYHWLIDFYFFVILPLACVGACGALIRDELQADTLGFLTTRPLTRAHLLLAKFLCQATWLQITALIQALLVFAVGQFRGIPSLGALIPLFLAIQFLAVLVWSALGAMLGLISKRYLALALVYGAIVEMGIGRIPTNINTLSMMRHLKTLLAHNAALQALYDWPASGTPFSIGALLVATGLFLAAAAFLFTFLEYHHTAEMQK